MQIKTFVRTFTSAVDAQMFNSVLHTKWPELIKPIKGARFRLVNNESNPTVSTVMWEFSGDKV
jgi:hypothetical protein